MKEDITSLEEKKKLTVSSLEEEVVSVKLAARKAEEEAEKASLARHEVEVHNVELVSV